MNARLFRSRQALGSGLAALILSPSGCIVVPSDGCLAAERATATVVVTVPDDLAQFDLEFRLEERDEDAFPPFALYCSRLPVDEYECEFSRTIGYDFEIVPYPAPDLRRGVGALEIEFDVLTEGRFSRLAAGRVTLLTEQAVVREGKARTSSYEEIPEGECGARQYAEMLIDLTM